MGPGGARGGHDAPLSYQDAGVDLAAGEEAVERIKAHVRSTFRPEVVGDVGGFGGLFALAGLGARDPVLVASTDGVGTKSEIARLMSSHRTIGVDLVAMSVDDIAVQGAVPLFFLDYISTGRVVPAMIDDLVAGVADGCRRARCALIGGEISEHGELLGDGAFDLVGFAVGVAERTELLPRDVAPGDRIVGIASPGLRCNGYSLARKALLHRAGRRLDEPAWTGAPESLGEELLRPSVVYAPAMAELRELAEVHAFAHVTGGGIAANLARSLPRHCDAVVRRGSWEEPRIFDEIRAAGDVAPEEMARVFNLGLGMLVLVASGDEHRAIDAARAAGHDAWEVGRVEPGHGRARVDQRSA